MRPQSLRRVARIVLCGMAAVHVLEALSLRRRREQVTALPHSPEAPSSTGADDLVRTLSVTGARLDERTLAAAAAEMEATGAKVVDLVPGDISPDRALEVLRRVDPERLDRDPLYHPGGAHEAVAIDTAVAERMGVPEEGETFERGDLAHKTVRAQRHALKANLIRVAPRLRSTPVSPTEHWREKEQDGAYAQPFASLAPVYLGLESAWLAALTAGVFVAPVAGAVALATWSAQPALVFGGATPDRDLAPQGAVSSSLLRLPRTCLDNLRTALAAYRETKAAKVRWATRSAPVPPTEEKLFEETRATCPWCGSASLVGLYDVPDYMQQKPVVCHLDECRDCGHVFQNPMLTPTGLDYIYDDFYGGASTEMANFGLGSWLIPSYEARVRSVKQFTEPKTWLDVGCAYGHFFTVARQELPDTTFDGLDMSTNPQEGQRRGWIDNTYHGFFPDLADTLPPYDVISMHHYLEHTRDPRRELAAAARVLEPGGHLEIEVPDPESPWGRQLGKYWYQWAQPQHLHFVTCDNLVTELNEQGFDVVSVQRGDAGYGGDVALAVMMWLQGVTRLRYAEWLPPSTPAERLKRTAVLAASMPAIGAGILVDKVKDAQMAQNPDDVGNGFRIVSRRR